MSIFSHRQYFTTFGIKISVFILSTIHYFMTCPISIQVLLKLYIFSLHAFKPRFENTIVWLFWTNFGEVFTFRAAPKSERQPFYWGRRRICFEDQTSSVQLSAPPLPCQLPILLTGPTAIQTHQRLNCPWCVFLFWPGWLKYWRIHNQKVAKNIAYL